MDHSRRLLIAGNWKMHGTRADLPELEGIAAGAAEHRHIDALICPPFTLIEAAVAACPALPIGGQDCHGEPEGAFTGNVSAPMLRAIGADHVIVGHSERRTHECESSAQVRGKAEAAIAAGLIAIVCVGETEAQHRAGAAGVSVMHQLDGSLPLAGTADTLVVAYEPVWAVGSGRTPAIEEIAAMHAMIRAKLTELIGSEGAGVRILYGGSVTTRNAGGLLAIPEVDGALIGKASLTAAAFVPILAIADALARAG